MTIFDSTSFWSKVNIWNTEVSVVPTAENMYFIQWIITSYYPDGYKLYRN